MLRQHECICVYIAWCMCDLLLWLPMVYTTMTSFVDWIKNSGDWVKDALKSRASIDFDDPNTIPVLQKSLQKSITMFLFLFLSAAVIYYVSTEKNALQTRFYYYFILIMAPIVVGMLIGWELLFPGEKVSYEPFFKGAVYFLMFLGVVYLLQEARAPTTLAFMNYTIYILLFLIILTGLAITYFVFSNYLRQQTGGVGLFARILFYLPCLFADFVQYLKRQLDLTPNVVYLLLLLEVVFVLLYIYLPRWIDKWAKMQSNVLLNGPVDLDAAKTVAGANTFRVTRLEEMDEHGREWWGDKIVRLFRGKAKIDEAQLYKSIPTYRDNNYSISFWAYVNAGSMSDAAYVRESNILNYAGGKPSIAYVNNGTYKGNKYIVYLSNSPNAAPFEIVLDDGHQKWNYFAITYHDHSADFFINGKLVRTATFNAEHMPLAGDENDTIVVGSDGGLKGAICNVSYFPYSLTTREIANAYNLLRFRNPPVVGL